MPKREMSYDEWLAQQWPYKHNVMSPQDMQIEFKDKANVDVEEEEKRRQKMDILNQRLITLVKAKVEKSLTKRQKQVIELYLKEKKQEDMGSILLITQEAVHSRLNIALKRLRRECAKDPEAQEILLQIKRA